MFKAEPDQPIYFLIDITIAAHVKACADQSVNPIVSMNACRNILGHFQYRRAPPAAHVKQPVAQLSSGQLQQVTDRPAGIGQRDEVASLQPR